MLTIYVVIIRLKKYLKSLSMCFIIFCRNVSAVFLEKGAKFAINKERDCESIVSF
ncbi:hypothetical protein J14TS2_20300 [Bacillus sp. J14TS2]|nr:hypothetical protein J14TS2_20300 [Bacillus sp. J14TS2]